jgi:hypothetical protein
MGEEARMPYVLKSEDGRYVDYFGIRKKGPEYSLHPSQSEAIKMPDAEAAEDVMTYFDGQGEPVRVVKLVPSIGSVVRKFNRSICDLLGKALEMK